MDRPSSHSQRVPYARKEGRKSLFSKMKDSMRDMLSPSWLTDLVHNVKKESPSDDKNVVKSSDPSTGMQPGQSSMSSDNSPSQTPVLPAGQAGMMGSSSQQAGINRDMQLKNRGTFVGNGQPRTLDFAAVGHSINPSGVLASPFQQGAFPPPISEFTSAQLPLARITEKSDSIMAQEDTMSQRSDGSKSTSGCSSMVPQPDVPQRLDTAGDKRKAPEQMTLGGTSPQEQQVAKRQRLHAGTGSNQTFNRRLSDTFISKQPTPAVTNRPAFNTSLFGSPLNNESSLLGTSVHESSFYPGKTKFGGRSSISFRSQRKNMDLNQSLPSRLSVPVKAFMKARPRLTPSKEAVTSSTAKRILEALDKMPTPLNDAKKIPMVPRQWTESPSFFSRDTNRSMTRTGPPTQKLNISSQASISKNRQVSFAPLQQSKATSSQVQEEISRRPTRQDTVILNNEVSVPSGKMKRDKSYHRGSASVKTTLEEDDTVIIPNLNTEFTLPVSSMPQFNFATPASQSNQDKAVKRSAESPVKHSLNFTFSSPIIEPVPANKPASPQKYAGFQFSSPISVDKNNGNSEPAMLGKPFVATSTSFGSSSTPAFTFSSPATKSNMDISFSTAPKPKPKVNGPVETSVGGIKVAAELKQGSVMDILGGSKSFTSQSSTPSTSAPPLSEIFKKTGWSCEVCLINNKDADSKCVACQTPKPGGQKPKGDTSSAPPLSEIFKKTGWSCDVCLINNKDADSKCVACQTPKPGGQKPKGDSNSSAPPLSEIFKKTGWSCDVCLINNKDADSKCVACQTPKPGGQKPKDVFSVRKSDPSEPLKSDLFAKFKQPVGSWTCDTCLIQNKQDDIKCVACQTRKPGSATSNTSPLVSSIQPGNWICNVCLIQNKKDDTICGACKAAKSTSKPSELNKSDSLFAKFKPAAGSWECEVCLVQNKSDDNKCVACQTPKPLKFFKHPPGDWVCDTCLVNNKASAVNCVACNYVRPGPPRTQAVPSIAKSYTVSQASGFNLPSTESGGVTISSTGGFKFTVPTSASSTASGFDVSKINTNKSADSKLSGGFKFNSDMKSETSTSSGFKFGSQTSSESDKPSVNSGGFKINALPPSGDKPTSGFQFGNKDMKPENKDGPLKSAGFQIGKLDSTVSSEIPSSSSEQVTNVGFVFGQKADAMSTKGDTKTTMSVPGGFSFKSSDSNSSSVTTNATETVTNTSKGIGGFNFTSLTSNSVAATTSSSSIGNFAFTATKVTDPSALSGTSNPLDNTKPSVGGFTFSQKPVDSNTSSSPFTFAQKSTSVASPTKRGRDDDTGEPAMKKSFGQPAVTTSSTPFQLGANSATTTTSNSSSPFVFGQTTATTLANAGPFAFGQQNSTPSTAVQPVFRLQNSTPASSALPSVFGQQNSTVTSTSSTSSTFVFGGQNATPVVSSSTSLPVFGQTNSIAATTTAPTSTPSLFQFGQKNQAPASTPFNFATQSSGQTSVFGNSNYNFTAQKTESSTSGSASGLFKFGGAPSQPAPATTPAFGSGSAFGSSSTPAFGSGSGTVVAFSGNAPSTTPAFGATPPAFGSSNSSTGQAAPAFGGVFGNTNQPAAPAQSSSVFQFGAKPAESTPAAPSAGFNFSASANPAGLGAGAASFNFSAQAPVNAFSATGPSTPSDRKIKKAVRKIRR